MKASAVAPAPKGSTNRGFTLIELLVTISIVALLAAIAIPAYISYIQRGIDEHMIRDLKNAAIAMESYYADRRVLTSSVVDLQSAGLRQTPGVTLTVTLTSPTDYTMTAAKPNGTQPSFTLSSSTGLIQ